MADWSTHLYCAEKVNQVLKFEGVDLDVFLYGNLLPDINPGWVVRPSVQIDQSITHFEEGYTGQAYFWAPVRFLEKYTAEIQRKNPIFLGYLFHLWIDVGVMTAFMSRVPFSAMMKDGSEVNRIKRNDLNIYIKKYPQRLATDNIAAVVRAAEGIKEISITKEDLEQVPGSIDNGPADIIDGKYHVFDEKSLDVFYAQSCSDFVAWLHEKI